MDINGDFRSDVLWVDETGQVRTWINQRGTSKSLVPYWSYSGITHDGMHEDVGGQQNIIFGRVWSNRPSVCPPLLLALSTAAGALMEGMLMLDSISISILSWTIISGD